MVEVLTEVEFNMSSVSMLTQMKEYPMKQKTPVREQFAGRKKLVPNPPLQ